MPEIERADIVETEDMVGVAVCDQKPIEPLNPLTKCLLSKVRRDIDQQRVRTVLDQQSSTQTSIARIIRSTGVAFAPDHGDAHRGSCSEECQFHATDRRASSRGISLLGSKLTIQRDKLHAQVGEQPVKEILFLAR